MGYAALVVGSGPAGIACAKALLKNGCAVTLLDAGIELEPEIRRQLKTLTAKPHSQWQAGDLAFLKSASNPTSSGLPLKTAFGSDFTYRGTEKDIPLITHHVHFKPTFAQGGFSTIWGAAMLPFCDEDIPDWPISSKDLAPHYRAILEWIPLAGRHDALDAAWPFYTDHLQDLKRSRQADALLNHLQANEPQLLQKGIQFGQSRLAVHAEAAAPIPACVYCGLCLYGCPSESIYETRETLRGLLQDARFTYVSDIVVKRVIEMEGRVTVKALELKSRRERIFSAERVFLGAGILSTTKILLDSLEAYEDGVTIKTSQHFMMPLLLDRSVPDVAREDLHTLAQVFLEIRDAALSAQTIHAQIYTYNDLYPKTLNKMGVGYLLSLWPSLKESLLGRLLIVQGYLHSTDSGTIRLKLSRAEPGQESRLTLDAQTNDRTRIILRQLAKKLRSARRSLGFMPLTPFLRPSAPGIGHHNGGTFPMHARPSGFQSDFWGRPHGFNRVHAIDASIFPSIPATTITLSLMANAHRIGSFHE